MKVMQWELPFGEKLSVQKQLVKGKLAFLVFKGSDCMSIFKEEEAAWNFAEGFQKGAYGTFETFQGWFENE